MTAARGKSCRNATTWASLSPDIHAERLALYHQGLNDHEIGRRTGFVFATIAAWRKRNGLPPVVAAVTLTPEERARRHLLYQLGYSDRGMAREIGIAKGPMQRWRERAGLPALWKRGGRQVNRVTTLAQVFERVRRAIGRALPRDIADDATMDMFRDILDGTIPVADIERMARRYGNRVLDRFASRYGPRSLDEELGDDGDGFRMIDLIRDDRSSSWLEEMGATVW